MNYQGLPWLPTILFSLVSNLKKNVQNFIFHKKKCIIAVSINQIPKNFKWFNYRLKGVSLITSFNVKDRTSKEDGQLRGSDDGWWRRSVVGFAKGFTIKVIFFICSSIRVEHN